MTHMLTHHIQTQQNKSKLHLIIKIKSKHGVMLAC